MCIDTVIVSFHLDITSRVPIYRQIVDQVRLQVARGELQGGVRMPSVRDLALELRINPNTVARAYRELEHEGIVVPQHGRGVFVAQRKAKVPAAQRRRLIAQHLDELLVAAWKLGVGPRELIEQLERRAAEFFRDNPEKEPYR